jgi:hypothetical protein
MPAPDPKRRWFDLSPDRFVMSLLLVIGLLWLSERFQWFGFNHHKGWTVLISVAAVGVAALVMLLWWAAGLIFGWRFQFGIRSVLAFFVACSIAAGWLAAEIREARRQAETVESITAVGGGVSYDWESTADGLPNESPRPPEPQWLRTMLGDDFFSTVFVVGYKSDDAFKSDDAYRDDTTITDAGLAHLKGFTELRGLNLGGTNITDAGLEHLKGLTQLRWLLLGGTNITDAGLEHLKDLTLLRELHLGYTGFTVVGVKKLQRSLPNCGIYH